jgi:hypothetical protein
MLLFMCWLPGDCSAMLHSSMICLRMTHTMRSFDDLSTAKVTSLHWHGMSLVISSAQAQHHSLWYVPLLRAPCLVQPAATQTVCDLSTAMVTSLHCHDMSLVMLFSLNGYLLLVVRTPVTCPLSGVAARCKPNGLYLGFSSSSTEH